MKIVSFAQYAGSPFYGMVFGHYYLAKEWRAEGNSVTLVAASYSHARRVQPQVNSYRLWTKELHDDIEYVWIKTPQYDGKKILGRMFNIIVYTLVSLLYALSTAKADTVISSSHHPFSIFPAQLLAFRSKCKLIFEVRDLWPLSLVLIGKISGNNPGVYFMGLAERYAYRTCSYVVSVLPNARTYMISKGLEPKKFVYIPNGVSFSSTENTQEVISSHDSDVSDLILSFKSKHDFVVGYFGRLGEAQELAKLIEVIASMPVERIGILLVGDGPSKKELMLLVKSLGMTDRVCFTGQVSKYCVGEFIKLVDICYLGLIDSPVFEFGVSPTKLNDYLLAAKPIVYAVTSVDSEIFDCPAIFPCNPKSTESMHKVFESLMTMDVKELDEIGRNGFGWAKERRNYKILSQDFLIGPDS